MDRSFERRARAAQRKTRRLERERLRSLRQSRRGILTPYARAQIRTLTAAQVATSMTRAGGRPSVWREVVAGLLIVGAAILLATLIGCGPAEPVAAKRCEATAVMRFDGERWVLDRLSERCFEQA